jgi:cytochrome c biogenesis protein CcmG/thiol:disulfide interchange protein DsbE
MTKTLKFFLPLAVFLGIAAFLFRGLGMDPRKVPSPLVNQPAPQFSLPLLDDPQKTLSNADWAGKVCLLNVWATWCVSCRAEHKVLMSMARRDGVQIYGLNYKDTRPEARQWLRFYGDPYVANAFDADGRVGIDWGVYGTPETFVIDAQGIVRYKHIGPISESDLKETLLPLIQKLKAEES